MAKPFISHVTYIRGNDTFHITGTGVGSATSVTINGIPVTIANYDNASSIHVLMPPSVTAGSNVTIIVSNGTDTSNSYNLTVPAQPAPPPPPPKTNYWDRFMGGSQVRSMAGALFPATAAAAFYGSSRNVNGMGNDVGHAVGNLLDGASSITKNAFEAGSKIAGTLLQGLLSPFGSSGQATGQLVSTFGKTLFSIFEGGVGLMGNLAKNAGKLGGMAIGAGAAVLGATAGAAVGGAAGLIGAAPMAGVIPGALFGAFLATMLGTMVTKVIESVSEMIGGILSAVGKAIGMFGEVVSQTISTIMSVIKDVSETSLRISENALKVSEMSGRSIASSMQNINAWGALGISGSQASAFLSGSNQQKEIRSPLLGAYGIGVTGDENNNLRQFQNVFNGYGEGLYGRMMKRNLSQQYFGDEAQGMFIGSLPQDKLNRQLQFSQNLWGGTDEKAVKGWTQDFKLFQASIGQFVDWFKFSIGSELLPYLTQGLEMATDWIKNNKEGIASGIKNTFDWLFTKMPVLISSATEFVRGSITKAIKAFEAFSDFVIKVAPQVAASIDEGIAAFKRFIDVAKGVGGAMNDNLIKPLGQLMEGLGITNPFKEKTGVGGKKSEEQGKEIGVGFMTVVSMGLSQFFKGFLGSFNMMSRGIVNGNWMEKIVGGLGVVLAGRAAYTVGKGAYNGGIAIAETFARLQPRLVSLIGWLRGAGTSIVAFGRSAIMAARGVTLMGMSAGSAAIALGLIAVAVAGFTIAYLGTQDAMKMSSEDLIKKWGILGKIWVTGSEIMSGFFDRIKSWMPWTDTAKGNNADQKNLDRDNELRKRQGRGPRTMEQFQEGIDPEPLNSKSGAKSAADSAAVSSSSGEKGSAEKLVDKLLPTLKSNSDNLIKMVSNLAGNKEENRSVSAKTKQELDDVRSKMLNEPKNTQDWKSPKGMFAAPFTTIAPKTSPRKRGKMKIRRKKYVNPDGDEFSDDLDDSYDEESMENPWYGQAKLEPLENPWYGQKKLNPTGNQEMDSETLALLLQNGVNSGKMPEGFTNIGSGFGGSKSKGSSLMGGKSVDDLFDEAQRRSNNGEDLFSMLDSLNPQTQAKKKAKVKPKGKKKSDDEYETIEIDLDSSIYAGEGKQPKEKSENGKLLGRWIDAIEKNTAANKNQRVDVNVTASEHLLSIVSVHEVMASYRSSSRAGV